MSSASTTSKSEKIFNENIGVLGHVDSGKTSLAKRLSEVASTACFDKARQSKERGMTLDLGFSAFFSPLPDSWNDAAKSAYDKLQFTLVDCPGHASLIRTILGGAQIIGTMLLVIDATKGIQTQTAECLVIGEITAKNLVVVVNKIDLLPSPLDRSLEAMRAKLSATMKKTRFPDAPIVGVSANHPDVEQSIMKDFPALANVGVQRLIDILRSLVSPPRPDSEMKVDEFLFSFDHCFVIKGQGPVITGTVLRGKVVPNQMIEFVGSREQRKVRSIQQFHRPATVAVAGDRAGICVTQFDTTGVERGVVAAPDTIPIIERFIAKLSKVRFYKGQVDSGDKLHFSIGHSTVMGVGTFFADETTHHADDTFDFAKQYIFESQLDETAAQFAMVELETPIYALPDSKFIGARLDGATMSGSCRLVCEGRIVKVLSASEHPNLFKRKQRTGSIQRIVDDNNLIGQDLFDKNADVSIFVGLSVKHSGTGAVGVIQGSFGTTGKFKVYFPHGIESATASTSTAADTSSTSSAIAKPAVTSTEPPKLILDYKKMMYQDDKATNAKRKLIQ